jgi:hypothetical protein
MLSLIYPTQFITFYMQLHLEQDKLRTSFVSQDVFTNEKGYQYLKSTLCGITSFQISLNLLDLSENSVSVFRTNVRDFISMANLTIPYTYIESSTDDGNLKIPIGYFKDMSEEEMFEKSREIFKMLKITESSEIKIGQDSGEFIPSFTLKNGTDHRGLPHFIKNKQFPLTANLVEAVGMDSVVDEIGKYIEEGNLLITSVKNKQFGRVIGSSGGLENIGESVLSSHIVVITDIQLDETPKIIFLDPSNEIAYAAVREASVEVLKQVFNGYFTALKKS